MALEILGYTMSLPMCSLSTEFDNDGWWAYHLNQVLKYLNWYMLDSILYGYQNDFESSHVKMPPSKPLFLISGNPSRFLRISEMHWIINIKWVLYLGIIVRNTFWKNASCNKLQFLNDHIASQIGRHVNDKSK